MPLFCSELGEAYAYQVRTSSKRLGTAVSLFPWNVRRLKKIGIFFFQKCSEAEDFSPCGSMDEKGKQAKRFLFSQ